MVNTLTTATALESRFFTSSTMPCKLDRSLGGTGCFFARDSFAIDFAIFSLKLEKLFGRVQSVASLKQKGDQGLNQYQWSSI